MGLKRRNKTSAEFSMSSLTDIIFLLLIFFMLTANFVRIDAFELPRSDAKAVAPTDIAVSISKDGKYSLNNKEVSLREMPTRIKIALTKTKQEDNRTIAIAAELGTPVRYVKRMMDVAKQLKVKVILMTQPKD